MKKTLNIGSGNRTYEEYPKGYTCLNMDERENLAVVDIVGDIRDMTRFEDEEFDYLLASDILEHFPIVQTLTILDRWKKILKVGGILELRVPNFDAIIRHYNSNKNMRHVSWMLMGGQEYLGNHHYVVFNEQWLKELCAEVNLVFVSCVDEGPNLVMKVKKV